jgi:hypothetical protein
MEEDDHGHHPLLLRTRRADPSSLEDDGIGHGHLHNSPLRKGGRWPWSSFFFLGIGRADLLFSRRYAMTTSTALY